MATGDTGNSRQACYEVGLLSPGAHPTQLDISPRPQLSASDPGRPASSRQNLSSRDGNSNSRERILSILGVFRPPSTNYNPTNYAATTTQKQ